MALNFPKDPTLNETYTAAGTTYVWDGKKWTAKGGQSGQPLLPDADGNVIITGNLTVQGSSISGNSANLSGDLSAVNSTLSGDLNAVNSTLSGDLNAVNSTLSGDLNAVNADLSANLNVAGDIDND